MKTIKVRRGLHELCGVTHTRPRYPGGPVCGGQVFAEWFPPERDEGEVLPASWECFCQVCGDCDPNGWPTLGDCAREAPDFWCEPQVP